MKSAIAAAAREEDRRCPALHEQIRVVTQRLCTRCIDEKHRDLLVVRTVERVEVLKEPRARAIQGEGVGHRRETLPEDLRLRRRPPPLLPLVIVRRGGDGRQQADQKLVGGAVEVRTGPGEEDEGILGDALVDPPRLDAFDHAASPPDRQPRLVDQVEDPRFPAVLRRASHA